MTTIHYLLKLKRYTKKGEAVFDAEIKLFGDITSDEKARQAAKKLLSQDPRRCWQKGNTEIESITRMETTTTFTQTPLED